LLFQEGFAGPVHTGFSRLFLLAAFKRGPVCCSFLALVLRKELNRRREQAGHCFEWADVKQDLKLLQEIMIEEKV